MRSIVSFDRRLTPFTLPPNEIQLSIVAMESALSYPFAEPISASLQSRLSTTDGPKDGLLNDFTDIDVLSVCGSLAFEVGNTRRYLMPIFSRLSNLDIHT